MGCFQQGEAELVGGGDAFDIMFQEIAYIDHGIKGAFGKCAGDVGDGIDFFDQKFPAAVEFPAHFLNAAVVLSEGGDGSFLSNGADAGGVVALNPGCRFDNVPWSGGIAQSPAGHGKGFRDAVDDDGHFFDLIRNPGDGVVFFAVVDQFFVDLIGDNQQIVPDTNFGNRRQVAFGVDGAGGVVG